MPTVQCQWVLDSGASHHMCNALTSFVQLEKLGTPIRIRLGDNSLVLATHHGMANITESFQAYSLYTPTFKFSLLSISALDTSGYYSTFGRGICQITLDKSTDGLAKHIIQGTYRNGVYYLDNGYEKPALGLVAMELEPAALPMPKEEIVPDPEANYEDDYMRDETLTKAPRQRPTKRHRRGALAKQSTPAATSPTHSTSLSIEESRRWHRRLAHLHPAAMRSLIDGLSHDDQRCEVCIKAKQKRKIVRIPVKPTTTPYELVHSDVCGPFTTPSLGGKQYFIVFVDDFSRYTEVFLLADKKAHTCTAAFQQYQAQAKARGFDIKRFRCDNGRGEYDNNLFRSILRINGILFEPSPPYAQHKNGISERTIGAITEKARAMMIDSQVPLGFWGEAVMTAAYLHRRTPHKFLRGKSPHEVLNGHNANPAPPPAPIHHLRRFGCRAYRLIPEEQRLDKKLGERSRKCMMVGYVHHTTKLWKLYDPEFKKVLHCSDVEFDEDVNCYISCPTMNDDGIDPFGLPTREPIHVEYYESEPTEESSGSRGRTLSTTSCATIPVSSFSADDSAGTSYFAAGAQEAGGANNTAAGAQKAGGAGSFTVAGAQKAGGAGLLTAAGAQKAGGAGSFTAAGAQKAGGAGSFTVAGAQKAGGAGSFTPT
jgi:transposase InsO family protein